MGSEPANLSPTRLVRKLAAESAGLQGSLAESSQPAKNERQFQHFAALASLCRAGTMTPQRSGRQCPGRQKIC